MQVVLQVVPEWMLEQLYTSFLRGSLATLAMHPLGNFGVQAYLSALQTPQQVRPCCLGYSALGIITLRGLKCIQHSRLSLQIR